MMKTPLPPVASRPFHAPPATLLSVVTAMLFASSTATAATAAPTPSITSTNPSPGPIRVTVAEAIDDAEFFQGWIDDRNPNITESLPPAPGQEQWIAIDIGGTTYHYEVTISLMRDGEPVGPAPDSIECDCNSATLLWTIDQTIIKTLEQLEDDDADPPTTTHKAETSDRRTESATIDSVIDAPRRRIGPLGHTGIGVGILGAGMIAGGIPLLLRPNDTTWKSMTLSRRSTHAPGIALVALGGVGLATGAALLTVDVIRRRNSNVVAMPLIGPRLSGVTICRRF